MVPLLSPVKVVLVGAVLFLIVLAAGCKSRPTTSDDATTPSSTHALKAEYARMQPIVDFESVADWAMRCMQVKSYKLMPDSMQQLLSYYSPKETRITEYPQGVRPPYNEERAVLTLNRALSFEREYYKLDATEQYSLWKLFSIATLILGALTTLSVSLSSAEIWHGNEKHQTKFRIAEIIFPVLGTTLAGVMGFFTLGQNWGQASHALASATQLHAQIALDVWKLKCIETPNDDNASQARKMIDEWSKRHSDILTVAAAIGATPTPGVGPNGPGK